jgi:acyl carrier protein
VSEELFMAKLAEVLEVPITKVNDAFRLEPESWDSLVLLSIIGLIDTHLGTTVPTNELKACTSVGELLELTRRSRSGG